MSSWPGKYAIGLTGNIATGKSLVRQMLEFLGAYGIDADALAHETLALGAPGYQPVLDSFGEGILNQDRTIDRSILASVVFSDPDQLQRLEAIVHPLVGKQINRLISSTQSDIFVIEAIKLIEAKLHKLCNTLWVTESPREIQLERLKKSRHMSHAEAVQRITAQSAQKEKVSIADLVIHNDGSITYTWEQVLAAWKSIFPDSMPPLSLPEQFIKNNP